MDKVVGRSSKSRREKKPCLVQGLPETGAWPTLPQDVVKQEPILRTTRYFGSYRVPGVRLIHSHICWYWMVLALLYELLVLLHLAFGSPTGPTLRFSGCSQSSSILSSCAPGILPISSNDLC